MAFADPLAYERQRYAEFEALAKARDLALRREMIRQEHMARHDRERAEYRASPVARRIRFARAKAFLKAMGASYRASYRAGYQAGRDRVSRPLVRRERPGLGQRLRGAWTRVFGRSRGGNVERERTQARERVQERQQQRTQQRAREQQQTRTSSWAGPEKQKQRTRTRSRARGQRCR